jgi:hypothetical protein
MGIKISGLTAKGATIADTDLVEVSQSAGGGLYTSRSVTGANIKALVTDANMTTSDITTNDVSTAKHGFAPKAPNDTTKFLRGDATWAVPASGGLTEFTELETTAAPNATVPVNSLTPVTATTNADFALIPKGNGALLVKIPDNAGTGGNKRGQYALDLQLATDFATRVASGNYSTIIGGQGNTASGTHSLASGGYSVASGNYSVSLGASTSSSTYTLAVGQSSTASADGAVSLGRSNTSSGARSFSSNYLSVASGTESVAMGNSCTAAGDYSIATGLESSTSTIRARRSHGNGSDSQASIFMLKRATTNNTLTYITADGNDEFQGGATNMFLLVNNQAMRFKGTIIGKQSGSANVASWDIDGLVVRTTSAANTTLVVSNVNVVSNSPAWGTPTLTANTTRGGVSVSVTGASATNIKWTAVIETTEVIYA